MQRGSTLPLALKIYKYRDLSNPTPTSLARVHRLISKRVVWCAAPGTLNDPDEFAWECDYSSTPDTSRLVADLIVRTKGRPRALAHQIAALALSAHSMEEYGADIIANLIAQCRRDFGLACFGTSSTNEVLWQRYAGAGMGVCVELDVPEHLLDTQLHRVRYCDVKRIHIDALLRSRLEREAAEKFYNDSLLTKSSFWAPEEEIRFVSKQPNVNVVIDGSVVTQIVVGEQVSGMVREVIEHAAAGIVVLQRD
jgi:hypothetical protein